MARSPSYIPFWETTNEVDPISWMYQMAKMSFEGLDVRSD